MNNLQVFLLSTIAILLIIATLVHFADSIDKLFTTYPMLAIVLCAPVVVWGAKRFKR